MQIKEKKKHLAVEAAVCRRVLSSLPFFLAMSHCSDFRLLLNYQYWICIGTPLRYPVVLCHEDLATLVLKDWCRLALQQLLDGVDIWVGQLKATDLGLSGS